MVGIEMLNGLKIEQDVSIQRASSDTATLLMGKSFFEHLCQRIAEVVKNFFIKTFGHISLEEIKAQESNRMKEAILSPFQQKFHTALTKLIVCTKKFKTPGETSNYLYVAILDWNVGNAIRDVKQREVIQTYRKCIEGVIFATTDLFAAAQVEAARDNNLVDQNVCAETAVALYLHRIQAISSTDPTLIRRAKKVACFLLYGMKPYGQLEAIKEAAGAEEEEEGSENWETESGIITGEESGVMTEEQIADTVEIGKPTLLCNTFQDQIAAQLHKILEKRTLQIASN